MIACPLALIPRRIVASQSPRARARAAAAAATCTQYHIKSGRDPAPVHACSCTMLHFSLHSLFMIGANGSVRGKKVSGLACWPPSPSGEPSLTVSMEDYWSLLGWVLP